MTVKPPLNAKPAAIRSGSAATLLLDGPRIHIQLSVICLESGEPGKTIRVTSKDHKQVYTAEIIDGTLLRGSL
jgi:flagella basal body P-ring formation protein FlgA